MRQHERDEKIEARSELRGPTRTHAQALQLQRRAAAARAAVGALIGSDAVRTRAHKRTEDANRKKNYTLSLVVTFSVSSRLDRHANDNGLVMQHVPVEMVRRQDVVPVFVKISLPVPDNLGLRF